MCPCDQPLAGTGQAGVDGVKMQALVVSEQLLRPGPGQAGGALGPRGDQGKPFVDGVQYRPHLIDGCLAGTGLRIEPW
jgi:hypothetical protein